MTYNELITELSNDTDNYITNEFKQTYGNEVFNYLLKRFYNHELLYEKQSFIWQFEALALENHMELLKLKQLYELKNVWELGDLSTHEYDIKNNSNQTAAVSYTGYNLSGDYSKNTHNSESDTKTNYSRKNINKSEEYNRLVLTDLTRQNKNIFRCFAKLFILLI